MKSLLGFLAGAGALVHLLPNPSRREQRLIRILEVQRQQEEEESSPICESLWFALADFAQDHYGLTMQQFGNELIVRSPEDEEDPMVQVIHNGDRLEVCYEGRFPFNVPTHEVSVRQLTDELRLQISQPHHEYI